MSDDRIRWDPAALHEAARTVLEVSEGPGEYAEVARAVGRSRQWYTDLRAKPSVTLDRVCQFARDASAGRALALVVVVVDGVASFLVEPRAAE